MNEPLLLIGHGTRDPEGVEEFLRLARIVAERRGEQPTALAFLEFARPTIGEAIEQLVRAGAERIVCQPVMLFASQHVKIDVPRAIEQALRPWPYVEYRVGGALEGHGELIELCRLRWEEAMARHRPCSSQDTVLLLAGRGSSDADSTAALRRLACRLGEAYGVGASFACYSGMSKPLVSEALEHAASDRFKRIVVQPYLLFTGILAKRIVAQTAEAARRHLDREVICIGHLGAHSLLADVFVDHQNVKIC